MFRGIAGTFLEPITLTGPSRSSKHSDEILPANDSEKEFNTGSSVTIEPFHEFSLFP